MDRFPSRSVLLQILMIGVISLFLIQSPLTREASQALLAARIAIDAGADTSAIINLHQAVTVLPWRNDLLLEAAQISLSIDDVESAILYFKQASQNASLPPDSVLALGDAYLTSGDTQLALQTWRQLLSNPEYAEAVLLRLLELHQKENDYHQLIDDYKSLIHLQPSQQDYYYQLGLILAVLDPDTALAYLSLAGENNSVYADDTNELISRIKTARLYEEPAYTSVSVGRWLGSVGEWHLALLAFQQATEQRPDYAEAWAYLAEALQQLSLESDSTISQVGLKELQTALGLDPTSIVANSLMSVYLQRRGDDEMALEYLHHAMELEPDNPMLQAELGRLTARIGDLPTAQYYYEKAVALAPTDPLFWRLLAEFSLDKQIQINEVALPAARKAELLAPRDPQSLDLIGKIYIALDELEQAEIYLKRAIALDADYPLAHLHLGTLYLIQGNNEMAQEEFELAKQLSSDSQITEQINRLYTYYFP